MEALHRTWEGDARRAYMDQYRKDRQDMENFCRALEEMVRLMDYAGAEYKSCEDRVRTLLSQAGI